MPRTLFISALGAYQAGYIELLRLAEGAVLRVFCQTTRDRDTRELLTGYVARIKTRHGVYFL